MAQLVLCFVSPYQNQGVGRAVFLSGDFEDEPVSKFMQVVDRTEFQVV